MVFTESGGSPTYGSITAGFRNWSDVTTFSPGGATTIWRSFDLTIENILRIVYDNTGAVNAIKRGPSSINGQFVLTDDFTNQEYTDLQAATTHTFAITITGLTYSITNSVWDTVARDVPIDDLILKTVTLMGGTPTLS
jgi:hypothetical protein